MDMPLLIDGVLITIMGMGTVFFFLIVLIVAMNINAKILSFLNKYFPEKILNPTLKKKNEATQNEEIALAIACVMRNNYGKN